MPSLPTRRLIDAVATLEPADRALLNLWINRALPETELLRLTRLSSDALAARRERIVERLGATLGLPGPDVAEALAALVGGEAPETAAPAPPAPEAVAPGTPPAPGTGPAPEAVAPGTPPAPEAVAPRDPAPVPSPAGSPRARRATLLGGLGLLILLTAAAAAVALTAGNGPAGRRSRTPARSSARPSTAILSPLPGGPAAARGTLTVTRIGGALTLNLRVGSLPAAPPGEHYEAWLFASVVDSAPLGTVEASSGRLTARLPAGAAGYPWIDVSLQRAGTVVHSGVSVLRAANPLGRAG
jgi:hypothetical protein